MAAGVVRGAKQTHQKGPEKLEKIGRFLENSSFSGKFQFFGTTSITGSGDALQEVELALWELGLPTELRLSGRGL